MRTTVQSCFARIMFCSCADLSSTMAARFRQLSKSDLNFLIERKKTGITIIVLFIHGTFVTVKRILLKLLLLQNQTKCKNKARGFKHTMVTVDRYMEMFLFNFETHSSQSSVISRRFAAYIPEINFEMNLH